MQAKKGSGFWGRRRSRVTGGVIALVALSAMIMPSFASATPPPATEKYLALGNSLAFGYSTQLYHEGEAKGFEDPELFEHGYANVFLKSLQAKALALKNGTFVNLQNDGCPGETVASIIGANKGEEYVNIMNAVLKKTQEEKGLPKVTGKEPLHALPNCEYQEAWELFKTVGKGGPLHHSYGGKSQLEDALSTIANATKVEKKPVTTLTIDIGANDFLNALGKIQAEAKAAVEAKVAEEGQDAVEAKLAKVAQEAIQKKVNEEVFKECSEKAFAETEGKEPEFEQARNKCLATEGKERGEKYYAENEAKLNQEGKEAAEKYYAENEAKVNQEGKEAAEKYAAEHAFELNAEGEEIATAKLKAAVPGLAGHIASNLSGILLAIRDAGTFGFDGGKDINYTGKIIVQGGYNPFGKQFVLAFEGVKFVEEHGGLKGTYKIDYGRCAEHAGTQKAEEEAIAGGCTAAALLPGTNSIAGLLNLFVHETAEGFGGCFTNPLGRFDPQTNTKPKLEAERLKLWTGMTNGTTTAGKPNGADVHPTPAGYKELAAEMSKEEKGTCHTEGLPGF